ncbi:MipA/OmpV family protein [Teredinibacter haidensis]|uniref:MipA/OmpV family protein n=1 Tax=Teredinibacter haidensis TaxID=2731755 RepID=UPI000948DA5E|nr:MipA/OmpV family protein [Teredinibacter haidensis]
MNRLLFTLLLVFFSSKVLAERQPKAELGVGFAVQHLNDYRGTTETQTQALPFPILVYRGERIQADKDGIRGRFFHGENWELNISAEAALNGGSEDNPRRQGMPPLDTAVEFGPSLNINVTGRNFDEGWALRLPVRSVFVVDITGMKMKQIGYNANPKFTYRKADLWQGWNGKVDLGFLWASDHYHDYYYRVAPQYAVDDRPAYEAESGFSGSYVKFSLKKRSGHMWYGWNLRYDYMEGAVFEDSPLVETNHYFSTAFAVGWFFWNSDTQ